MGYSWSSGYFCLSDITTWSISFLDEVLSIGFGSCSYYFSGTGCWASISAFSKPWRDWSYYALFCYFYWGELSEFSAFSLLELSLELCSSNLSSSCSLMMGLFASKFYFTRRSWLLLFGRGCPFFWFTRARPELRGTTADPIFFISKGFYSIAAASLFLCLLHGDWLNTFLSFCN